jgi:hypothetical protein
VCAPMIAVLAVSAALSAYASYAQGKQQEQSYKAQAQMAANQAVVARTEGELRAADVGRRGERIAAQQAALFGASGVDPFSGSPADVQADTASGVARDQFNVRYDSTATANNLLAAQSNFQNQANNAVSSSMYSFVANNALRYGTAAVGAIGGGGGTPSYTGSRNLDGTYNTPGGMKPGPI